MNRIVSGSAVILGIAIVAGLVAATIGGAHWRRQTAHAVARITAASDALSASAPLPVNPTQDPLPPPVARYFSLALPDGDPSIRSARIGWHGSMRLRPDADWVPFTAVQHLTARPPGFVWAASVRMLPGVAVQVRDECGREWGSMLGRIGGVVPVVNVSGTPEIAASALVRWLGEAVWMPSALLPGTVDGVCLSWEAVDDSTARATVRDGGTSVSAEFTFGPGGEITRMAALRYRESEGTAVLTPFEGVYNDYARRDGFLIPMNAEVAWVLREGRYAYWRGRPVETEYQLEAAPRAR